MQIHITRGEDSSGPFTLEQVRDYLTEGILLPDDLAWHEGLENWIPLSQLVAPPVAPQPVAAIPAVPEPTQTVEPVAAAPMAAPAKSSNKKLLVVGIIVGVLVLGGATAALFFFQSKDPQVAKTPDLPGEKNPTPLSPDPSTFIPGLPGVDTNAVPIKPEPTNLEPSLPAKKPGTVLWEFETGHQAGGPSIGNDGTVYVGSVDKKVYALDGQTGVKKWEFETGGMVISSPVIGPDNTVYVGSYDKKVYALNGKTGAKKWDFETGKPVASSPAIGADGIIYIGGWDGKVYALDSASGVKKWEFEIQNGLFFSPVVGFNNTVYAASVEVDGKNGVFCALDGKTGGKKWVHKAKKNVTTYAPTIGPAIASDNVVYLGISLDILGDEGKLIALDGKTGTVKWEFDLNCLPSPPVIGADKIIYFGTWGLSGDGLFYSVDGKSGLKKWEYKLQGDALGAAQMIASPAIGDNGTIYIGANTGRKGEVLALNGKSGAKKWALKIGAINGIVIGNDGTIYVGSLNKKVYAIKTDSKGPAKSPWPMRGQNPQHSGRAIGGAPAQPTEPTPPNPTQPQAGGDADSARILEQAIRRTLRKSEGEALTPDDFAKVTFLSVSTGLKGPKVKDLTFLQQCPNLQNLFLQSHEVKNLSPLTGLTKLTKINLTGNQVTDLSPLAKLPALTEIWLQRNGLVDLKPLASIKSLERLYLDSNPIEDLSPLAGLSKLETLGLSSSKIIDLTPLGGLANLNKLQITDTPVHNYKALKALTSLGEISFSPQADTDFGAVLGGMEKLKSISISKTKLPDLTGLVSALPNPEALETINIFNCDVQNIEALAECKNLRSIHMMANRINDLSAFKGMNVLTGLFLSNNKITDIKPLAEVPNLGTLWLSGNFGLTDVSPLLGHKKLRNVLLRACRVPEAQLEELRQAIPRCSVNGKAAKK